VDVVLFFEWQSCKYKENGENKESLLQITRATERSKRCTIFPPKSCRTRLFKKTEHVAILHFELDPEIAVRKWESREVLSEKQNAGE
jgi:hypothetical protein